MPRTNLFILAPTHIGTTALPLPNPNPTPSLDLVEITRLPSGLTVASQDTTSHLTTLGVLLPTGSRFEAPGGIVPPGSSHLFELMSLQATPHFDASQIRQQLDDRGSVATVNSSREQYLFCVDSLREHTKVRMRARVGRAGVERRQKRAREERVVNVKNALGSEERAAYV